MLIALGSTNPSKREAVEKLVFKFPSLCGAEIQTFAVASAVAEQPLTLSETIAGACNRARAAFSAAPSATLGIGIEGGLMLVSEARTGYMNVCAAALFAGTETFIGLSSAFEHPRAAVQLVMEHGLEIKDAYVQANLESSSEFSKAGGAIGFMTDQQVSRSEYCLQALVTALASFNKKELL